MTDNALAGIRILPIALSMGLFASIAVQAALAADCPGHPGALGTSRTLMVNPLEHPRIGTMQYAETLPLRDHEVVLTFDDGPLPRTSNQVLDILASQCVKATFFIVGRMARAYPEGVRKLAAAGHSIGTHSENHPLNMNRMPIERSKQEIDNGIASTTGALGNTATLAPFFRIPGLAHADGITGYLTSKGLQVWSADFPADDWQHISSARVYDLAMKRLERKRKGILLLHDIQPRTVAALPRILRELKARGYRIVHVAPATPQNPATPTEPQEWQLHPPSESVAISPWPKIPNFIFTEAGTLPVPSLSNLDWPDRTLTGSAQTRKPGRDVSSPRGIPWSQQLPLPPNNAAIILPVPAHNVFEVQEGLHTMTRIIMSSSRHAEQSSSGHHEANFTDADNSGRTIRDKPHSGYTRQTSGRKIGHARRGTLKHLVLVKKKNV